MDENSQVGESVEDSNLEESESSEENERSEEDTSVWQNPVQSHTDDDVEQNGAISGQNHTKDFEKYRMSKKCAGSAIIFNHEKFSCQVKPRPGTDEDCESLEKVLKEMRFKVKTYKDLKYEKIKEIIQAAAKKEYPKLGCIMIVVMTHGSNNCIDANDGSYRCKELWEPFKEENCPSLANRPKLFIVQACQGNLEDVGLSVRTQVDASDFSDYEFFYSPDFLIVYSTVPLHVSWRNPINGTRMIQELAKGLNKHAKKKDILTILTLVNQRVSLDYPENLQISQKQVMRINSTLTRLLFFEDKSCSIL